MRRLRERRASALIPVDGPCPLPEADQLAPAVEETLAALGLGAEHAAAVQLARRYSAAIDQAKDPAWAARWLGPLLLQSLEALGATPAAKAQLAKGAKTAPQGPNRLDQLRASRGASDRSRGRL